MSSSSSFSLDHLPPAEKLCYVHCGLCDTVLAVGVPCSSLSKTVTVRCGHCSNLLAVNMRGLLNQLSLNNCFLSPSQRFLEEIRPQPSSLLDQQIYIQSASTVAVSKQNPKTSIVNRPPEKRQRVPSAYNRFIKEEIQRIKAVNPDISHREAFSAAAKNWAHFPHIQFGLMPDQKSKKANTRSQEWEDNILQDGFLTTSTVGLVPY